MEAKRNSAKLKLPALPKDKVLGEFKEGKLVPTFLKKDFTPSSKPSYLATTGSGIPCAVYVVNESSQVVDTYVLHSSQIKALHVIALRKLARKEWAFAEYFLVQKEGQAQHSLIFSETETL